MHQGVARNPASQTQTSQAHWLNTSRVHPQLNLRRPILLTCETNPEVQCGWSFPGVSLGHLPIPMPTKGTSTNFALLYPLLTWKLGRLGKRTLKVTNSLLDDHGSSPKDFFLKEPGYVTEMQPSGPDFLSFLPFAQVHSKIYQQK